MAPGYRLTPEETERIGKLTEEDFGRLPAPKWKRASNGAWAVTMVCPDGLIRTLKSDRARGLWPVRSRPSIPSRLRFQILNRDEFRCYYCGRTSDDTKLHVDHLVPRKAGGTDPPRQPCHRVCRLQSRQGREMDSVDVWMKQAQPRSVGRWSR